MIRLPISVTILTKNSQKYLKEVLEALASFDEVLICDTGSEDNTLLIAQEFPNAVIYKRSFIGFGPTHNIASSLARNDWILSVDSDEVVTGELAKEIADLKLAAGHVYSFPRHNEYRGKWIKWCGWHPDRQIRLFNRAETRFTDAQVHESIIIEHLKHVHLQAPLRHYSYDKVADFLTKMQSYSTLFATQYQGRKHSSFGKALSHGSFSFFKSYILKRGFLGGQEGFEISFYNAATAFYKYLKLAEANRQLELEGLEKCGDGQTKKLAASKPLHQATPNQAPPSGEHKQK
ncbi:glycosyl transferase family 2 protein [Candidatus Protochlamydia naegleriophila]|uniref:Glycosyl transferase family 2 protein n=1 Tax=Candidatus Protochlamydia naegleriophila TaxID=389348 RepID=A0A0U5JA34_9BACT|nr:glycosyltransferase family 2 protein [Candidatus Protochlamydia naegleriophila]CUI15722.1 glycosyl transferase family 2 protein [Candidatus Protochlamydia naegleriophila]